jgi:ABC-type transport system involved in multi-copper enzyme maturation permease subunit
MKRVRLTFPLLTRELTEQAARRRTYAVRVLYAGFMFAVFLFVYLRISKTVTTVGQMGSSGTLLFSLIVLLQLAAIVLYLPAAMASAIAGERERGTLGLLLTTDLSAWEIILQKFCGRLLPVISCLMLALPLMAVAYSFGGLTLHKVIGVWVLLIVGCLHVGAVSLAASAWCRSTVSAVALSYIAGAILSVPLISSAFGSITGFARPAGNNYMYYGNAVGWGRANYGSPYGALSSSDIGRLLDWSGPSLLVVAFWLLLARIFLVTRKDGPASRRMRRLFARLDRLMHAANDRFGGGVVLVADAGGLPVDDPVAWREMNKRLTARPNYLIRLFLLIECPLILVCAYVAAFGYQSAPPVGVMILLLWALTVVVVAVTSVQAIAGERARQTLDVLLTTPISGHDIIHQKMAALRRLHILLFLLVIQFATLRLFIDGPFDEDVLGGFLVHSLTGLICIPLLAWTAMYLSLRMKSRTQSLTAVLILCGVWLSAPVVATWIPGDWVVFTAILISPFSMSGILEMRGTFMGMNDAFVVGMIAYSWYLFWFIFVHNRCLRRADKYLGRTDG